MTEKFTSEKVLAMADMLDEVRIESQPRRDMQSDKIAAMLRSLLSERTAAAGEDISVLLPKHFPKSPTIDEFRDAIVRSLENSEAAIKVLSTILRTKNISGFNVCDEILGDIKYAKAGLPVLFSVLQPVQPVASVPKGWKLAPVDPSQSMRRAGASEVVAWGSTLDPCNVYRAMIAAAPTTPTEGGENG